MIKGMFEVAVGMASTINHVHSTNIWKLFFVTLFSHFVHKKYDNHVLKNHRRQINILFKIYIS